MTSREQARESSTAPTCALVIPVVDRPVELRRSLASVRQQETGPDELVIVDDGSSEDMQRVFDEARADGAVVLQNRTNCGPAATRNRGAEATGSEWLVFLDADDELTPSALSSLLREASDGCGLVRARFSWRSASDPRAAHEGFLAGTFAVRRQLFVDVGGYDPALRFAENAELLIRLRAEMTRMRLRETFVKSPTVTVTSSGRSRAYDEARMNAAIHILAKHSDRLSAHPRERAEYAAIAAVNAARLGRFGVARRVAWTAVRAEPLRLRHGARFLLLCAGPLSRRVWSRSTGLDSVPPA